MPPEKGGTTLAKSKASAAKAKKRSGGAGQRAKAVGSAKPVRTAADVIAERRGNKYKPLYYLAAFFIPFLLTLIAYINFDVYPFGERSVLTLDLNGQYIYYFESLRDAFWGDGSAFYSWSRNLSGGFMGIIGYYLASPFTLIVILLPRKMILESMMIMQMCKVGAAGLTFCIYAQKSKGLKPLQSLLFSNMYAMMAYVVIQLIDPMWIDGPIFLPLIILGVEYLIDDGRKINYIIPTALMFIANFYIGFMIAIFIALYFVYYLFFGKTRKYKDAGEYAKTIGVMVGSTVVVMMCSIIMILPVYNALALGKFDFSEPDYSLKTMFNPIELVACMLPNQYYSVNVDTGTGFYGRPEIYCGVMTFLLLPMYAFNKKIKANRKIGYGLLMFILLFSMYIKPINMLWHGGQDPNWLPYRYSFILSFIMVSMAAEAFSKLDGYESEKEAKKSIIPLSISAGIVGVLTLLFYSVMEYYKSYKEKNGISGYSLESGGFFAYNESKYKYVATTPYTDTMNHGSDKWDELWLGTIGFGMALLIAYFVLIYIYSRSKKQTYKKVATVCMAALIFFEGGYNCYDSFRKIFKEVGNSDKSTYTEIMSAPDVVEQLEEYDSGFYRAEKTYNRMVNDNLAYGLKGISHSSSVMNARAIKFIETMGYFTQSFESKYEGCNPVADSILGIKYVLDDPSRKSGSTNMLDASYQKIFSTTYTKDNDQTSTVDIYENPNALSIGYMADDDITILTGLGNDNPFNSLNNFLSSMTGNTEDYTTMPIIPKQYYIPFDYEVSYDDSKVYLHDYTNSTGTVHDCYEAFAGVDDAVVNIHVTVPHDGDIYMHLGSEMRKACNVWVSSTKDEDGNFYGHEGYGTYFNTNSSPIVRIGPFDAGTEVEVRLTIQASGSGGQYTGSNEYLMVRKNNGFNFYYLDEEAFEEDINKLKQNEWVIDTEKSNDRYLVGEVDAQQGQILMTTIPYEPGWKIKVDGKTIDSLIVQTANEDGTTTLNNAQGDTGEIIVLGTLIGIKLPAGHHTVSMKYTPPGFTMGVVTLILGIGILVMFYIYDSKNNKILIARRKDKELLKKAKEDPEGTAAEAAAAAAAKKDVKIIKSKGAVAEKLPEDLGDKAEDLKDKVSAEDEKANKLAKNAEENIKALEEEAEKTEDDPDGASEQLERAAEKAEDTVKKSGGKGKNKKK